MLLTVSDTKLMNKYLIPEENDTYRLKDIYIPDKDLKKLHDLDDLQLLCYGSHMIEDWKNNE